MSITRSPGIVVPGTPYMCGDGYTGKTNDLDAAVQTAADRLAKLFGGADVVIRFNHDRESGGAFIKDGKTDAAIGIGASQYTAESHAYNVWRAEHEPDAFLRELFAKGVEKNKDRVGKITYDAKIDLAVAENDIEGERKFRCWDFDTLDEAVSFLKAHCFGIPGVCRTTAPIPAE